VTRAKKTSVPFIKIKTNVMKKNHIILPALAFMSLLCLISFRSGTDNFPGPKTSGMIKDWERAKVYTMEYLTAANEETIDFKPTPDMRSFGQQMLHLSEVNYGLGSAASGKTSPIAFGQLEKASDQYKSKEALTKAVMESYDFVISALKEFDESKMNETIKVFNTFEMSREAAFHKTFEHQTHHRGQTTVYLRLKGVTPPNEKLF
jgi:uncharacterized damage-inducible protein DinB